MCFVSNSSTMIINLRTTHCCSSGGSRSAAAGKGRRGRGGEATEDGFGRAGGDTSGVAASLTASVRLALAGSKTRQRRPDGYRSAHKGKSVDSADLSAMATVFPGVCPVAAASVGSSVAAPPTLMSIMTPARWK